MSTTEPTEVSTDASALAPTSGLAVPAINLTLNGLPYTTMTSSGSTTVNSAQVNTPPMSTPENDPKSEERIRHFQAEADRAKAEAEKAKADLAEKLALIEQLQGTQKQVLDGAAQLAQDAVNRAKAIEEQLERSNAERMKAEALMSHPHLAPYAAYIPATTDASKLAEHIQTFEAARTRDLEALKAVTAPATQQQQPLTHAQQIANLYPPGSYSPPLNPGAPSPAASTNSLSTPQQMRERLETAMAKYFESGSKADFDQVMREQIAIGESYTQQQLQGSGLHRY